MDACASWFFLRPRSHLFDAVRACGVQVRHFSGRLLPDMPYSALLGSTVDTCYFQFMEAFGRISYFSTWVFSDPAFDAHSPAGVEERADEPGEGFFEHFSPQKKCEAGSALGSEGARQCQLIHAGSSAPAGLWSHLASLREPGGLGIPLS